MNIRLTPRLSPRVLLTATAVLWTVGCDGGDGESAAEDSAPMSAEPRVAVSPTADDALPPSVLGQGGALEGLDVAYVTGDSATNGYLAVPQGDGPFPAVILIHEWNGLVDRVRQVADDLAAEGYVALAADLYSGRTGSNAQENSALMAEIGGNIDGVIENLDAAAAFLRARSDVTGRIATMGWCFGGGIALSYGIGGAHHDATAIFYGTLIDDPEQLAMLDHEVYGTFAEMDQVIPTESVERFVAALEAAGIENDVHVYDEVGHGFWLRIDEDPESRSEPGLDAWQRVKAYLQRTLR